MRLFGVMLIMVLLTNLFAADADLRKIREQAAAWFSGSGTASEARRALETQQPDGSWRDVNYADRNRGHWAPRRHLSRAVVLAAEYRRGREKGAADAKLRDAAVKALGFWAARDCTSPNWWHQSIGTPMELCSAILLLGDGLPSEVLAELRPILDRSEPGMTAQNRVWLAGIQLLKGAIFEQPEWVREGADAVSAELHVAAPGMEGIQPDWSFHQHGPQLQFGNYGLAYFSEMTKWLAILHGTRFALPEEKAEILTSYYRHGLRWVLFDRQMDFSACGRQINGGQVRAKYRSVTGTAARLNRVLGVRHRVTENDFRFSGSRYFPDSDFYVQRNGGDCYWSVKMSSSRTVPSETVNSENLLGRLAGHGATMFMSGRGELVDIGALWEWRQIPGVTSVQDDSPLVCKNPGLRNKCGWVGGLSDDEIGFCAMDFDNGEVAAKKSFFFFGPGMIAVGSDIRSGVDAPVVTTIAQMRTDEEVAVHRFGDPEGTEVANGAFLYRILKTDGKLSAGSEERTGNWKRVTEALSDAPVRGRIFTCAIDHGRKPENAFYAYQVVYLPQAAECSAKLLETGSESIHAVAGKDAVMAAFHEAGTVTLPDGTVLEAKQPALVMLRNGRIYAADPGRKRKILDVVLAGRKYRLPFPQGAEAGRTVSVPAER